MHADMDAGGPEPDAASTTPSGDAAVAGGVTVTGPITGGMGRPFTASIVDLASYGYSEKEFFFEDDAAAYAVQGEMSSDGQWQLAETMRAPFKSRMIVRRPNDAGEFNGTVVVEWLNVSAGADGDPGFMYNWQELLREGYVWVGVSAQAVGVEGGGFALVSETLPLKQYDPERYGTLSHPGDAYSFDIYTRAAEIIRGAGSLDVLEGLRPERLIAYGESQSAMRMVAYVNGVQPLAQVYDGFFIHSRSAGAVPFGDSGGAPSLGGFGGGGAVLIRDDLDAKVFQFQTETDVLGMLGYLAARQPDTDRLRTWEVAGTAHADQYLLDLGKDAEGGVSCEGANDGPQQFVLKAALHALNLWLTNGAEPPPGEPLATGDSGVAQKDDHGNTLGGGRTPDVDVPIAELSGDPAAGGDFICFLFGHTTPFTPEKLLELYPTHDDYVTKVRDAARQAREARYLLEPEEQAIVAEAEAAAIP
jgi:hypothetical protein